MESQYEKFQRLFDTLIHACERAGLNRLQCNLEKGRQAARTAHAETHHGKTGTANLKAAAVNWELPGIRAEYGWRKNQLDAGTRQLFDEFLELYPREVDRMYWRRRDVRPDENYLPAPARKTDRPPELWELPEPDVGDVLLVRRHLVGLAEAPAIYEHYAVYLGHGCVMHYAGEDDDFCGTKTIHEAPLSEFARDSQEVYKLEFPIRPGLPCIRTLDNELLQAANSCPVDFSLFRSANYHLFTPLETVARARSREGEQAYTLLLNNCEHFAVWCKTGVKESFQVNRVLQWIAAVLPMSVL